MADITKQSYEEFRIHADFGLNMADSEELVLGSCTVVCVDKDNEVVTTTLLDASALTVINGDAVTATPPGSGKTNAALQVLIKGGTEAASNYKYTFKGVTDLTPPNKWEIDISMRVRER